MRKVLALLTLILLFALVPAALAGGWATITMDDMPGEIRAGEPWSAAFTVLQHGKTPVHKLGSDLPITPRLTATNAATGERVEARAEPDEEVGHFTAVVTFPSEGEWEWEIEPAPLAGDTQFEPLTILPAAPAPAPVTAAAGQFVTSATVRWVALFVALAAVALFAVQMRRRAAQTISPESSR